MFKVIVEKEIRDTIGSSKFAVSFAVCAILILMAFYVGAVNYQISMERYEAAKTENLRKLEGITDWLQVQNFRIFLPPHPLSSLVSGVSNDVGRTIEIYGQGELAAEGSRYNEDPIFAVFRFLDLEFIFAIVLSLFAILLGYDAVSGEKENGTLRLAFANAVPRSKFILAKLTGSFLALAIPLLLALGLGCLLLPAMSINLSGSEWLRLILIIVTGLLYFGVFLTLSTFISAMTQRTSSSFLILLVIWIGAVLIVPRASVLLAGRAVEVPSVDEILSKKNSFSTQLWKEHRESLTGFRSDKTDVQEALDDFNQFMDSLNDYRESRRKEYYGRLNEERRNRQLAQQKTAFVLARISPASSLSFASSSLAGTGLFMEQHYMNEAQSYQDIYNQFMFEKTGMKLGKGMVVVRWEEESQEPEEIDPSEIPEFVYSPYGLTASLQNAVVDMGLLVIFNLIFFVGAFTAFQRYDLR